MGGCGSGRKCSGRTRVYIHSLIHLDVRKLFRWGALVPGSVSDLVRSDDDDCTIFMTRAEADHLSIVQLSGRVEMGDSAEIPLDWTSCHYGGKRPWFRCPGVPEHKTCHRRVAILYYLYHQRSYFLCRKCYGLVYPSQYEDREDRVIRRAQKIRLRLGGSASLMEPFPSKPKGMHWDTYSDLWIRAKAAEQLTWRLLGQKYGVSGEVSKEILSIVEATHVTSADCEDKSHLPENKDRKGTQ